MSTPRLDMDEIVASQANKYITHNQALRVIDGLTMCVVQDKDLVTSPAVSSSDDGKCYIVAGTGGDWSTFSVDDIAQYYDDSWYNMVPEEGWRCWVVDEDNEYYYDGADWQIYTGSANPEFDTAKIGDVAGGDYTEFEADGTIELNGDATVWKDDNIAVAIIPPGVSAPDLANFDTTTISVRVFDGGATLEQLSSGTEIQHDYKEGSDIVPHIHWCPTTAGAGDVVWFLEILIKTGTTVKYSGTLLTSESATGTAWEEIRTNFPTLSIPTLTIGDQVIYRLYRDPTFSGDTYSDDAGTFTFGFHYEIDTLGSRQITTK